MEALAVELPRGDPIRAPVQIGKFRVTALFDSGAARSIIEESLAESFYKANQQDPGTAGMVKREDLDLESQVPCTGIKKGMVTKPMKRIMTLDVGFQETEQCRPGYKRRPPVTRNQQIHFAELPDIAERLLIGAPDLVAMGFSIHEDSVSLPRLGVTLPRVKRPTHSVHRLELVRAYCLDGNKPGVHTLQVIDRGPSLGVDSEDAWIKERHIPYEGVQVIEQPLKQLRSGGDGVTLGVQIAVQGLGGEINLTPDDDLFELVDR